MLYVWRLGFANAAPPVCAASRALSTVRAKSPTAPPTDGQPSTTQQPPARRRRRRAAGRACGMPRVCTCQRLRNLSRLCRRCCRSSATTSPRATRAPGPRPANTWRDAPRANAPARAGKASAAACPAPASAASAQTRARGTPPNAMNTCPRGTAPARSRAAARRPPHAGTSMRAGRLAHSGRTALGSDGTDAHRGGARVRLFGVVRASSCLVTTYSGARSRPSARPRARSGSTRLNAAAKSAATM